MAINKTVASVPATTDNRTWRANIETPLGGAPSIQVFREDVDRNAEGAVVGPSRPSMQPVNRAAAAIASESVTVTVGGQEVTVSAAAVIAALPVFFDRWTQEDITAGKRPA